MDRVFSGRVHRPLEIRVFSDQYPKNLVKPEPKVSLESGLLARDKLFSASGFVELMPKCN